MSFILSFGTSGDGQLGNGADSDDSPPICIVVPRGIKIVALSAGSRHSLALTSNGAVYSFGWGVLGQLGLGNCLNALSPTRIQDLKNVVEISAGGMHSGCVTSDHKCYTWGSNGYGQLGVILPHAPDSEPVDFSSVPMQVYCSKTSGTSADINHTPLLAKHLSCGGMHSGAIDIDGNVWCWGRADSGQIGFATKKLIAIARILSGTVVPTPYLLQNAIRGKGKTISCGAFHTLILNEDGVAYAMGKDDFGMLGSISDVNDCMTSGYDRPTVVYKLNGTTITDVCTGIIMIHIVYRSVKYV